MNKSTTQRRLAAILAADVVGYSRLMGQDEAGTHAALKAIRGELIDPKIAEHSGRVFKATGDGLLAEFPSVVNAVGCAMAIQEAMRARSASQIQFRIGLNVGDVIVEDGDVFGDGVNVAARIESLASPGGIALTEAAREHLGSKLKLDFTDTGTHSLKNIERPVRVFVIKAAASKDGGIGQAQAQDRPSIAVLPFQNMSGDPEQEYFADGIVEEIITALSQFRQLFIIARNTSFTYKGRAVDVKQVGRDLGVRYVLEGSVRKSANRIRITGQLIDSATGAHLWADRFEGSLEDIFDLQDQVTSNVVAALVPKVEQAEIGRARRKPTESLDAYDHYLRGLSLSHQWTKDAVAESYRHFQQALALDPEFAVAYGWAARSFSQLKAMGVPIGAEDISESERLARKAADLGRDDAAALATAAIALAYAVGELDDAEALADRAIALNPNLVWSWHFSGWVKAWQGKPEAAIEHFKRAIRLSPKDAQLFDMQDAMASAYFVMGNYKEALAAAKAAVRERPFTLAYCIGAASAVHLEDMGEAQRLVSALRRFDPNLRIAGLKHLFTELKRPGDFDRLADGLRRAGLPE